MALGTPTNSWLTSSEYDGDWTAGGSIGTFTDDWNNSNYGNADGVDDQLAYTAGPYFNGTNTSGVTQVTLTFWFKRAEAAGASPIWMFSQWSNTNSRGTFAIRMAGGGGVDGQLIFTKGPTSGTTRQATSGSNEYDDDTWYHCGCVWDEGETNANAMKIYINGSLVSGSATGTDGTWPSTFLADAYIYRRMDSANHEQGSFIRHKVWIGKAGSAAEMLQEYNDDILAQSAGSASGTILDPIVSPIASKILDSIF